MIENLPERDPASAFTEKSHAIAGRLPDVSIVIVNWNSKDFLRQCLRSVFRYTQGVSFEVIVVDNASFDGCAQMLAREFPSVIVGQSAENIGFARANNLGVRYSRGRHLLFLNPDTELLEDSIAILLKHIESVPDAGAIGCRLLNSDGTLQTSCVQSFPTVLNQLLDSDFLHRCFPHSPLWGTASLHSRQEQPVRVEIVSGACIFVKREVFDRVGGFTESYFMYGEDLDLCFKIARAGYVVYHTGSTNLIHHGGGSSGQSLQADITMRESVRWFLRLNRGVASADCYRLAMAIAAVVRIPLIIALMTLGRAHMGSLRKWWSILRWSVGLESRALADTSNMNKHQSAGVTTPVIPLKRST